jgi:hypothetical protein
LRDNILSPFVFLIVENELAKIGADEKQHLLA